MAHFGKKKKNATKTDGQRAKTPFESAETRGSPGGRSHDATAALRRHPAAAPPLGRVVVHAEVVAQLVGQRDGGTQGVVRMILKSKRRSRHALKTCNAKRRRRRARRNEPRRDRKWNHHPEQQCIQRRHTANKL